MKSSGKRKRAEVLDDPEFIALQKSLQKSFKKNNYEEEDKNQRRTFTEDQKKIVIKLSYKYPKSEVSTETGISINNIKSWRKKEEEDLAPKKRGKRVMYPEVEEKILSWIITERGKKIMYQLEG